METPSSSSENFMEFTYKHKHFWFFDEFMLYIREFNPDVLFVISRFEIIQDEFVKYKFDRQLISRTGEEVTDKTIFVEGNHELFQQLCKGDKEVHLLQCCSTSTKMKRLHWLEATVGANVSVFRRHTMDMYTKFHTTFMFKYYVLKYDRPVTIIMGESGMGKTTCLHQIMKHVTAPDENQVILYLNDIKLREFYNNFPSANVINFTEFFAVDLTCPNIHIMYDNFELLKERDVIIDIMTDLHLNHRHVKQWIVCSSVECRNKLESRLGTFAIVLDSGYSEAHQLEFLKKELSGIHGTKLDDDIIFDVLFMTKIWRWKDACKFRIFTDKHKFSRNPLNIKILASWIRQTLPTQAVLMLSILDVYDAFVESIYTNENIEELAVVKLFEYYNYDFKFKKIVNLTSDGITFDNVNVILYLVARWFSKNFREYRTEFKLLLDGECLPWTFQYFFNSLLCRNRKLHTKTLNNWTNKVYGRFPMRIDINERDAGGRTAMHLVVDEMQLYELEGLQLDDVKDEVLQWTPIQYFEYNRQYECVNRLLGLRGDDRYLTRHLSLTDEEICTEIVIAKDNMLNDYATFLCRNVKPFEVTPKLIYEMFNDMFSPELRMKILRYAKKPNYHYVDSWHRTAVFRAVYRDDLDALKYLINNLGFDIYHKDQDNETLFPSACARGNMVILKYLQQFGFDETKENEFTFCCKGDKLEKMEVLIENGFDVNIILASGETPLEIACKYGSTEVVHYLLENATRLKLNNIDYEKLLHITVEGKFYTLFKFILSLNRITNINKKFDGETVLHKVCDSGCVEILSLVMEAGADVNATDNEGNTPLFNTVRGPIMKILAENGCNMSHVNNDGYTPVHMVVNDTIDITTCAAFRYAPYNNRIRNLLSYGAEVNARTPCGDTPLHLACQHNKIFLIHFLVSQGADIHAVNNQGETPLHLASVVESTMCEVLDKVKFLVLKGADVNAKTNLDKTPIMYAIDSPPNINILINLGADINCKDSNNRTLLHYFAEHNLQSEIEVLAKQGLRDAKAVDSLGQTALHVAVKNNHMRLYRYLLDHFDVDAAYYDNDGNLAIDYMPN